MFAKYRMNVVVSTKCDGMNIFRKTSTPNKGASGSTASNGGTGGDRFIPNRASSNFDLSHHKVQKKLFNFFHKQF